MFDITLEQIERGLCSFYMGYQSLFFPLSLFSGLISDKGTIEEAVTSVKRNGVGLKGIYVGHECVLNSNGKVFTLEKVFFEPSWMRLTNSH